MGDSQSGSNAGLNFASLTDLQLLEQIAFFLVDYKPEVQTALEEELKQRSLSNVNVQEYRRENLGLKSGGTQCNSCKEDLILDENELLNGTFTCPECGTNQLVNYKRVFEQKPSSHRPNDGDVMNLNKDW